jgi:RimJ/RimL family protein N-acetyltransferase
LKRRGVAAVIEGNLVTLCALERHDLMRNYVWANDRELIRLTGMQPFPRNSAELERWYEQVLNNPLARMFAVKTKTNEYIGNIEISNIDYRQGKGELGIMIGDRKFRGKGLGREAIMLLAKFVFEELRFNKLYARVLEYNEAAQKCFVNAGFKAEGRDRQSFYGEGKFWDILNYGILAQEFKSEF